MIKKIRGSVWLPLLIAALGFSAVGIAATGLMHRRPARTVDVPQIQPRVNRDRGYVNRGRLSPRLTFNLNALGNRLEKPGKERLTITGELRSSDASQASEITAILEYPDRLRLVKNGAQSRSITFDGQVTKEQPSSEELDLIESLTYDSAEHFFNAQMQGNAMRFLGSRFRTDDGSSPDYSGPYFDIYKIADRIDASGEERASKLYYFNSDTLLLERVTYIISRNGSEINIETKLSDWRDEDGQKVACRIERLENGRSVFVLNIRSAQFGKRAEDGSFQQ
jgi:hypothetical protein